jgi:hypothetical protein
MANEFPSAILVVGTFTWRDRWRVTFCFLTERGAALSQTVRCHNAILCPEGSPLDSSSAYHVLEVTAGRPEDTGQLDRPSSMAE